MLSVLVVSPDPTVPGGVSVFIAAMKRRVTQSRIDSFFVGSSGRGESPLAAAIRLAAAPLALGKRIGRKRYDVVHLNPSFDAKSLIRDGLLLLALRAAGYRRVLFYIHGFDVGVQAFIQKNFLLRRLTGWVLNRAAVITVLGAAFRDALMALGVDPACIIVTRTMFDGEALRATPASPAARPNILFMSRFDREKGGRELLQAFIALAADFPDTDLILAGTGSDEAVLRNIARQSGLGPRIRFPGYVGGAEKARLLHDCAIFALPTYYRGEGMPVAVLEAMGAGKPLLVGCAGAMRAIARDPENGVVLDKVTAQTVEAGLRRLLADPARPEIGARNAEIAWQNYEAAAVTAEIEALYHKVALC